MAFFKSLFRRPLTHSDLLREARCLISKPPLPQDLKASIVGLVGGSGVNLLDYWRDHFRLQLKTISCEETWSLQRAKLLKLVMTELGWRAVYTVAENAKSVDSWSHLFNDDEWTYGKPKEQWKNLLLQRWIIAILSDACLRTTGARAYALDRTKEADLDPYYEFDKAIKSLDVNLLDLMNLALLEYRDDDAQYAALALRWSDLDVEKKTLKVERALEYTKKIGLRFKGPKHDRHKRTIKIDDELISVLLKEREKHLRIAAGIPDGVEVDLALLRLPSDSLMFPGMPERGTLSFSTPRHPNIVTKLFGKRAQRLGFKDLRLHDLRGTFETHLLDQGVAVHVVAERCGHHPAVLLENYAKRRPSADQHAAAVAGR